ncbi:hypothetical protein AGMMS50249_7620 [candidate division SR1 bacterium]|nr:hypothetical protein AGMMS50249_7620 [candidate division SR1 bacterium]
MGVEALKDWQPKITFSASRTNDLMNVLDAKENVQDEDEIDDFAEEILTDIESDIDYSEYEDDEKLDENFLRMGKKGQKAEL